MYDWIKNLSAAEKKTMKSFIEDLEKKASQLNVEEKDMWLLIALMLFKKMENIEERLTKLEKKFLKERKIPEITEDLKKY